MRKLRLLIGLENLILGIRKKKKEKNTREATPERMNAFLNRDFLFSLTTCLYVALVVLFLIELFCSLYQIVSVQEPRVPYDLLVFILVLKRYPNWVAGETSRPREKRLNF